MPQKDILTVLRGRQPSTRVPLWLMRQAGRYLPEYRALRGEAQGFLELCLTPELAAEATLQPIRRYPLDAAIIFSDILIVPHALGQCVRFEEGKGPLLDSIRHADRLDDLSLDGFAERLSPVAAAIDAVRRELPAHVALFGFAGAPWTVATYMVEGRGGTGFETIKAWAYREPESFGRLIDLLTEATSKYLVQQIEAGVDVLQIFDSWAGALSTTMLERWGLRPTAEIVRRVKSRHPDIPIVVFPRGIGASYKHYAAVCGCDGLSLDTAVPSAWAAAELQPAMAVQGNLDPVALVAGGGAMKHEAENILHNLARGRFIFNLGHGILPQTPPEHVAELCHIVHAWPAS